MKCMFRGGEMEQKTVPYSVDRKGYPLYIREVPAYVCSRFGEQSFDETEVEEIQVIVKTLEQRIEELRVA
ncbi:MAG: YgiT-type zinc finger protein [Nitrospirae bacterium]|nr:YgiT-type zinc finger protein [Nitrospirota bacterium]